MSTHGPFEIQIAGLDIAAPLTEDVGRQLRDRYSVRLLRDLPALKESLSAAPSTAPGSVLIIPASLIGCYPEIEGWLETRLPDPRFRAVILDDGGYNFNVDQDPRKLFKIPTGSWLISSNISRLVGDLGAQLDQLWVKDTIEHLYAGYEQLLTANSESAGRPQQFVSVINSRLKTNFIRVYRLRYPSEAYQVTLSIGTACDLPSIPLSLAYDTFQEKSCHSRYFARVDSSRAENKLPPQQFPSACSAAQKTFCQTRWFTRGDLTEIESLLHLSDRDELIITSSFFLDGASFLVLYAFDRTDRHEILTEACNFASREIGHVIRGAHIRTRYNTLAKLTYILQAPGTPTEMYWEALELLKHVFDAHGASLIELVASENDQYSFRKFYVHYGRHETEVFRASQGYAVEAITKNRALLIRQRLENASPPVGNGLEFDPLDLEDGSGREVAIPYVTTQQTVEHEASVMYFPLAIGGDVIAALQIAHFNESRFFHLADLRDLSVYAGAMMGLILHGRMKSELDDRARIKAFQEQMGRQAETLFFYREIALGVFHQLANHLAAIRGALAVLEGHMDSTTPAARGVEDYLQKAVGYTNLSKELINDAHKRGMTLKPIPRQAFVVNDVVRPAIEYAQGRLKGTDITVRHSLTSRDYQVWLDVKLAREGLINVFTNAIWAIKSNKTAGKKEIFVIVREDSGTVRIDVTDSGIGMPKEVYDQVAEFMPFVTFRDGGTGLGLYFTKRLLAEFGGTVSIPWSQPQKGTTISISLPCKG